MSQLPQISEQHRQKNKQKLIQQNTKLQQEIFLFQQQINHIITDKQLSSKIIDTGLKRSTLYSKDGGNSFNLISNPKQQPHHPITSQQQPQSLLTLLQENSPLITNKIIPELKNHLQYLKSTNIKQNIHYILKQQDQLKITKKELYKLRRQKQLITENVKDKESKLEKKNKLLEGHKEKLREELKLTVMWNRETSGKIVELEREIRKYHLASCEYKKLTGASSESPSKVKSQKKQLNNSNSIVSNSNDNNVNNSTQNPQKYLQQLSQSIVKYSSQITQINLKWKPQLDTLDKQYYQLKQQYQKSYQQHRVVELTEGFYKTRVLVMKDQDQINQQKDKKKLLKANPLLQKLLEDYLKEEQHKIKSKENYLKKQRPWEFKEDILEMDGLINSKTNQNNQNTVVETSPDDKNIIKLKNYLKHKQMVDKEIQVKLKKGGDHQRNRLQRSWSFKNQQQKQAYQNQNNKDRKLKQKQKITPRILLKSVKLGTTFHYATSQEQNQVIQK